MAAIGIPIRSIYPTLNGMLDKCVEHLNKTFYPLGTKSSKLAPIFIMWTSASEPHTNPWTYHFVSLLNVPDLTGVTNVINLSSLEDFLALNNLSGGSCPTIFDNSDPIVQVDQSVLLEHDQFSTHDCDIGTSHIGLSIFNT